MTENTNTITTIPNHLAENFHKREVRKQLMKEYGNSSTAFMGQNEDGETVLMSINADGIILKTYQNNGWIRLDYYDEDGDYESEMYEGRWDKV